ncbi:MAG: hypothetical protein A2157_11090 [Deltaproteobacteria bacterium RBG_16_47_11]|nr:MAG: hypothetical protein A2157_11090 [Deltaproteobacteria bacterium RBG_16_47_11]
MGVDIGVPPHPPLSRQGRGEIRVIFQLTFHLLRGQEGQYTSNLSIQGTSDAKNILFGNMGIDHGGLKILVTQQLLNGPDIVSVLQEVGGKTVPQGMHGGLLCNPCLRYSNLECLLK